MKIRIQGNSLRLRLSQQEVITFVQNGMVQSECQFINGSLFYSIHRKNIETITAAIDNHEIKILIPSILIENWDVDDRVGFDATDANGLYILIEKDFQCLKPRLQEDESDLFPNPNAHQEYC
jgi:hypothetical protein